MKILKIMAVSLVVFSGVATADVIDTGYSFGDKVKATDEKVEGSKASYILDISDMKNEHIEFAIGSYEDKYGLCQISMALKFNDGEFAKYIKKLQEKYGKPITYEKGKTDKDKSLILWESESDDFASLNIRFLQSDMSKASVLAQSKNVFKCQEKWYGKK